MESRFSDNRLPHMTTKFLIILFHMTLMSLLECGWTLDETATSDMTFG